MDASNLKTGYWFLGTNNGFSKYVKVYDFDHDHIRHTSKDNEPLDYSNFEPIPLTHEVLIKWCKFVVFYESDSRTMYEHNFYDAITFQINKTEGLVFNLHLYFRGHVVRRIDYLHEFQNVIEALTGEKMEVTPTNKINS